MMKSEEMDSRVSLKDQLADDRGEAVTLAILFTVDPDDAEAFKAAWAEDAAFTQAQPGFISAQLHQGIGGGATFLDLAVFESAASLEAMTRRPEFGPLRGVYPDGTIGRMHLFRRIAIPGICVGEVQDHGRPKPTGRGDAFAEVAAQARTAEAEVERLRARVAELERRG